MGKDEKIIIDFDQDPEKTEDIGKTVKMLVFELSGEKYCIGIDQAKEVIRMRYNTRVPNTPDFVLGVINLRGTIVPLVDIRYFFGLEGKEKNENTRIITTDITGSCIGILADTIKGMIEVSEDVIQPPLATLDEKLKGYTIGHIQEEDEIFIVLNLGTILNNDEMNNLRKGDG